MRNAGKALAILGMSALPLIGCSYPIPIGRSEDGKIICRNYGQNIDFRLMRAPSDPGEQYFMNKRTEELGLYVSAAGKSIFFKKGEEFTLNNPLLDNQSISDANKMQLNSPEAKPYPDKLEDLKKACTLGVDATKSQSEAK